MSKICKICWLLNENILLKYCKDCFYNEVLPNEKRNTPKPIKRTPLKRVWEKRKKRIKEFWTETVVFEKVYKETKYCQMCWVYVMYPAPWCFAHILSKKMYPHLRLFANNITFVCWEKCHRDFDRLIAWENKSEIEAKIMNWKNINPSDYAKWNI